VGTIKDRDAFVVCAARVVGTIKDRDAFVVCAAQTHADRFDLKIQNITVERLSRQE